MAERPSTATEDIKSITRERLIESLNEDLSRKFAMAEHIREILIDEQEHLIDLATALGEDVPNLSGGWK